MKVQITSVNMKYDDDGDIESVKIHFYSNSHNRSVSLNGHFSLSGEDYKGNESVKDLEKLAKDHVVSELQKEDDAE